MFKDGKSVDRKEISAFANNLQIQTENMCQFLPQDRVREFPEMKPDQIFQNSLKAVGDLQMLRLNKESEQFESQRRQYEQTIETKNVSIQTTNRQYASKKAHIEEIQKRQELEFRIDMLETSELDLKASACRKNWLKDEQERLINDTGA